MQEGEFGADEICEICGASLEAGSFPLMVMIDDATGRFKWATFCSWRHLSDWAASEPELEQPVLDDPGGSLPVSWQERLEHAGVFLAFGVLVVLATIGFGVILRALFL